MADNKVLTAPLAIIKFTGTDGVATGAVGKLKNIRVSESFQRGDVKGIGALISSEKPIMAINCTFSASAFFIDLTKFGTEKNPFFANRGSVSLSQFLDSLLFNEKTMSVYLYRPMSVLNTTTGFHETDPDNQELVGTIKNVYLDSYNFDISEGAISGTDLSGTYLEPILLT